MIAAWHKSLATTEDCHASCHLADCDRTFPECYNEALDSHWSDIRWFLLIYKASAALRRSDVAKKLMLQVSDCDCTLLRHFVTLAMMIQQLLDNTQGCHGCCSLCCIVTERGLELGWWSKRWLTPNHHGAIANHALPRQLWALNHQLCAFSRQFCVKVEEPKPFLYRTIDRQSKVTDCWGQVMITEIFPQQTIFKLWGVTCCDGSIVWCYW